MNFLSNNLALLLGAPESAGSGGQTDPTGQLLSTVLIFGLVFVVFYFLIIRPQNKKQKEAKKMLSALKKGDRVQTIGGLRGVVWQLKEDSVVVKADDNVKLEFVRSAISNVLEQKAATQDDTEASEPKDDASEPKTSKEPKAIKDSKASKDDSK